MIAEPEAFSYVQYLGSQSREQIIFEFANERSRCTFGKLEGTEIAHYISRGLWVHQRPRRGAVDGFPGREAGRKGEGSGLTSFISLQIRMLPLVVQHCIHLPSWVEPSA